jgi:hypothetical protein
MEDLAMTQRSKQHIATDLTILMLGVAIMGTLALFGAL